MSGSKKSKADLKVVLLGPPDVGKTTLVVRYVEGCFQETISTIGASFFLKRWGPYNAAIWDTAGGEKYSGLSSFYCRQAGAAILAYDICSAQNFLALRERFLSLLSTAKDDCLRVVVGTKLDLVGNDDSPGSRRRQVTVEEGLEFAREINEGVKTFIPSNQVPYFETSSRTGEGVEDVFKYIFTNCLPAWEESGGKSSRADSLANSSVIRLHDCSKVSADSGEGEKKCGCK